MPTDTDYSRRRLLQALTGAGVLGVAGGAATGAYLSDRANFFGNRSQAGSLTMEMATATFEGNSTEYSPEEGDFEDASTIPVTFPDLEPGDEGVLACGYRVCESPGIVWLRTLEEGADDTKLDEYLRVELSERPDCGEATEVLFEGTLADLLDSFADGTRLRANGDCIECESTCLDLAWSFDEAPPAELANDSLSVALEFAAVQCRHRSTPENPWN